MKEEIIQKLQKIGVDIYPGKFDIAAYALSKKSEEPSAREMEMLKKYATHLKKILPLIHDTLILKRKNKKWAYRYLSLSWKSGKWSSELKLLEKILNEDINTRLNLPPQILKRAPDLDLNA